MTHDDIRAEINADPLGIGYRRSDPFSVRAALCLTRPACTRSAPQVPIVRAAAYLAGAGLLAKIYRLADDATASDQVRSLCIMVRLIFERSNLIVIDLADPETAAMLTGLVATQVITQAQADAFAALQMVQCSRAEQLWGDRPTQDQVTRACQA